MAVFYHFTNWLYIAHLIINYRIKLQTKDVPWIFYVERIQLLIVIITINGLRNDIVIAHICDHLFAL